MSPSRDLTCAARFYLHGTHMYNPMLGWDVSNPTEGEAECRPCSSNATTCTFLQALTCDEGFALFTGTEAWYGQGGIVSCEPDVVWLNYTVFGTTLIIDDGASVPNRAFPSPGNFTHVDIPATANVSRHAFDAAWGCCHSTYFPIETVGSRWALSPGALPFSHLASAGFPFSLWPREAFPFPLSSSESK